MKLPPEQIGSKTISSIIGSGSTCTSIKKVSPTQLPDAPEVGVTVYLTTCSISDVLVNTCLISVSGSSESLSPSISSLGVTTHSYVVFIGTIVLVELLGEIINSSPEHITAV